MNGRGAPGRDSCWSLKLCWSQTAKASVGVKGGRALPPTFSIPPDGQHLCSRAGSWPQTFLWYLGCRRNQVLGKKKKKTCKDSHMQTSIRGWLMALVTLFGTNFWGENTKNQLQSPEESHFPGSWHPRDTGDLSNWGELNFSTFSSIPAWLCMLCFVRSN